MDVAMAMLLISASVLIIGIYLNTTDGSYDTERMDRTAETLAGSTIAVQYDLSAVENSDEFTEPEGVTENDFRRVDYGSALGLVADATVTNVHIHDTQTLAYADDFEAAVDANVRSNLVGANDRVYIQTKWEPYEGATAIGGEMTVGSPPPPHEDVSSATLSASSSVPDVTEADIRGLSTNNGVNHTVQRISEQIALAIVEGYFPPEATQHSLESQGMYRSLKVYHYQRMGEQVDVEFDADDGELSRTGADAPRANNLLVSNSTGRFNPDGDLSAANVSGLVDVIAYDIYHEAFADEIAEFEASEPHEGTRAKLIRDHVAESVATGDVTITIQTWER